MTQTKQHSGLILPSLIWLGVAAAALFGAYMRGADIAGLWPMAAIAAVPAVITLCLTPWLRAEWAQVLAMFAWAGLTVLACAAIGFVPMALMFLCVPAIAMLFLKEKVVEGLVISALLGAILLIANRAGYVPASPISETQKLWGTQSGIMGTIALLIGAMFTGAQSRMATPNIVSPDTKTGWDDGLIGGLLDFGLDGNLDSANLAGTNMFGLDGARRDITLGNLLNHDAAAQGHFDAQVKAAKRTQTQQEQRLTLREGDLIKSYDIYLTPLKSGGLRLHAIDREQEEAKLELLRRAQNVAQRDSADKTLFFAGVSHELRTPLNAIIGFSDMMRSRLFGPLPGKYAEYADLIHDSGQHMLDLIGDVLDLSKVEAGKYELSLDHFDAVDVVRSSAKMIRPAADAAEVALNLDVPESDALLIHADRRAVRQILLNLLSNAVKFSNKGGQVHISAKRKGTDLWLSVKDNGPGMSAEEIANIGTPYAQGAQGALVKDRGTGLGLSLVQSLTDLHRGQMDIDSVMGEGTQVTVSLPMKATY